MKLRYLLFLIFSFHALAQDEPDISVIQEESLDKFHQYLLLDAMTVTNAQTGIRLSGGGIGFQVLYGFHPKFGVGMGAKHIFDFAKSGGMATVLDFRFTWAVTGTLQKKHTTTDVGGPDVIKTEQIRMEGLRLQALGTQYLFNGTTTTVPFTGLGVSLYYELSLFGFQWLAGGRLDRIVNDENKLYPVSGFIGIGF